MRKNNFFIDLETFYIVLFCNSLIIKILIEEVGIMILYPAILKTIDPKKDEDILQIHLDYLNNLISQGKVFAKGPFTDHSGGLIIFKVNSLEEARELIENDPVIVNKSREYELKEWRSNVE